MSMYDEVLVESEQDEGGRGWRPHPVGEFSAVVEGVKARTYNGQNVFDIICRTDKGTAKMGVWETTEDDLAKFIDLNEGDEVKARAAMKGAWLRVIRLYKDLGFEKPASLADLYDDLGSLAGSRCTVVVLANTRDPKNPKVYINAPSENAPKVAAKSGRGAQSGNTPGVDDVPF